MGRWSLGALCALVGFAACGDDATPPLAPPAVGTFVPQDNQMQRLLARQYRNSIELLLGAEARAAAAPPADTRLHGFSSIASSQLSLNDELVAQYEGSALAVATAAMGNGERIAQLMDCQPTETVDAACYRSFIERFGRLAWRRPLQDDEVSDYVALASKGADEFDDFYAGLQYVLAAMLQSPNFLFRVELGEADDTGVLRLTPYELASRLSFFLHDRTPSETLLDAAEAGDLATAEGVRLITEQLVAQQETRAATASFFEEYLTLIELDNVAKDPALFPSYSKELAQSMGRETAKLIDDVVFARNAPLTELFDADYTFVDQRLAEHYGTWPPSGATWTKMTLPTEQGRLGILSHASILTRQAHTTNTSATYRGLFIMERFLCQTMSPPPSDVVTELPPSSVAPTLRERIAVHLENPDCAKCHEVSDPLGLALENFDAIGQFRTEENGEVIDARVHINGLGEFEGAVGLGTMLANNPDVMDCVMRNVVRHALGHVETASERPELDALHVAFADSGYRFKSLLVELANSELFRTVGQPSDTLAMDPEPTSGGGS